MAIKAKPLLQENSDSDDIDSGLDDPTVEYSHEEPFIKHNIPNDRYNLTYVIVYLLGINTLIPWSFFITADNYWRYKFNPNESHGMNFSHIDNLAKRTDLQTIFTSYISIASGIPNTVFLILNIFISKKISLSTRMIGSQCVVVVVFILTTSFVRVNTYNYQNSFMIVTLTCVAIVNAASAIFGGSLVGLVGRFSPKYITAMSAGQALAGIFTALTEILSLWIGATPLVSGLLYFIIGDIVLLLSLIAYVILEREAFFKHHIVIKTENQNESEFSINNEVNFVGDDLSYLRIFKRTWHYGFSMFLVFFMTMMIYPSVTVLIESQENGNKHAWNDIYFVPVIAYLLFSCGDYIGRILSGVFKWPNGKPYLVMFLSFSRGIFIPAFLFCNAQPRYHLPVYIYSDMIYIVLTVLFSFSNGYLCNIIFMQVPTVVDSREKEIASAMQCAFLGIGVVMGSSLSLLMIKIL